MKLAGLGLALVFLLSAFGVAAAAPVADLWPRWQAHNPQSVETVDHSAWTRFLKSYVVAAPDGINRVGYGAVTAQDRQALASYIGGLAAAPVTRLNRSEQFAYWVNLYNALTVEVVLKHYPVASIQDIDISPGLFTSGPWGKKLVTVEGEQLSLDDIEHRILRPIWRDPRIHYAVNCASVGCPDLLTEAFTPANAETLLERGARRYVNSRRGAQVAGGRLVAARIYDWYQADFGGSAAGVIDRLRRYADPPLRQALASVGSIAEYRYDWSLNDLRG